MSSSLTKAEFRADIMTEIQYFSSGCSVSSDTGWSLKLRCYIDGKGAGDTIGKLTVHNKEKVTLQPKFSKLF